MTIEFIHHSTFWIWKCGRKGRYVRNCSLYLDNVDRSPTNMRNVWFFLFIFVQRTIVSFKKNCIIINANLCVYLIYNITNSSICYLNAPNVYPSQSRWKCDSNCLLICQRTIWLRMDIVYRFTDQTMTWRVHRLRSFTFSGCVLNTIPLYSVFISIECKTRKAIECIFSSIKIPVTARATAAVEVATVSTVSTVLTVACRKRFQMIYFSSMPLWKDSSEGKCVTSIIALINSKT